MATRTTKVEKAIERADQQSADQSQLGENTVADILHIDSVMARVITRPVESWLKCQAELLKSAEPVALGWIERRCDSATAALGVLEKLALCNDLSSAAAIQRDWFEGAMRRLDSDVEAIAEQARLLSQEAVAMTRLAAQTTSEAATLAGQQGMAVTEQVDQAA